jgi:catechol 2,3-dioxygenase-like lactoylglutathione lyase family enzyme
MLKRAIPVLHVSSSVVGEEFYCGLLGFEGEFAYRPTEDADPCYLGLKRDEARLHLSSFPGDGAAGSLVYLLVDDVDALHRELRDRGVRIDMPPTDQSWGNREMYVRDPDNNKIAFVQPTGSRGRAAEGSLT